jgi:hypothetical protein
MDLRTTGMEFASEMGIKANLFKMKIAEVPTILSKDGRSRPPHLRPWRDGWRHLRFMLLFSPRWLFFIPGLFLLAVSSVLYSLILAGPVQVYGLFLDIHTLFYMQAAITIALTALLLGVTARMFGMREGLLQEHRLLSKFRSTPILEIGGVLGIVCAGTTSCFMCSVAKELAIKLINVVPTIDDSGIKLNSPLVISAISKSNLESISHENPKVVIGIFFKSALSGLLRNLSMVGRISIGGLILDTPSVNNNIFTLELVDLLA